MSKPSWNNHTGNLIATKDDYDLIECETCDYSHIIPIPNQELLKKFYNEHFYDVQKPDYFEKQKQDLDWWNLVYSERYQLFDEHLNSGGKRLLDVGCGPGFFMKFGEELGWDTLGIEPSSKIVDQARSLGLNVIHSNFDEKNSLDLGKFDVIHMQGVMEHLSDPIKTINLCFKLLKPGGIFCTVVANDHNPLQQIIRKTTDTPLWWFVPPEHINYFTISSIRKMGLRTGFKESDITTTFPIDLFLLMGDNYIGNDGLGRVCHNKRKSLEFAFKKANMLKLKKEIYKNLSKLDLGRDIIATFIKPN